MAAAALRALFLGTAVVSALTIGSSVAEAMPGVSDASLHADIDRDGMPDTINIDPMQRSVIHLRLSSQPQARDIQMLRPVLSILVADLDGDGNIELVTSHQPTRKNKWFTVWQFSSGGIKKVKPRPAHHRRPFEPDGTFNAGDARLNTALPGQGHVSPPCNDTKRPVPVASGTVLLEFSSNLSADDRASSPAASRAPPSSL